MSVQVHGGALLTVFVVPGTGTRSRTGTAVHFDSTLYHAEWLAVGAVQGLRHPGPTKGVSPDGFLSRKGEKLEHILQLGPIPSLQE